MGLLFREHPKAQPGGGFWRSPGSNLRPLVYKASDLTTAPRRARVDQPKVMTLSPECVPILMYSVNNMYKYGNLENILIM